MTLGEAKRIVTEYNSLIDFVIGIGNHPLQPRWWPVDEDEAKRARLSFSESEVVITFHNAMADYDTAYLDKQTRTFPSNLIEMPEEERGEWRRIRTIEIAQEAAKNNEIYKRKKEERERAEYEKLKQKFEQAK